MGKRRKRLTMAKYAKKYASIRATMAKLQNTVEDAMADGVITEQEQTAIETVEAEVAVVLQTVSPPAVDDPVVEEVLEAPADDVETPVVEEKPQPVAKAKKSLFAKKKKTSKPKTTSSAASKRKPKDETNSPD